MCSITLSKKINYDVNNNNAYKLSIKGLMGGHSGDDIDKNRANAIKIVFQMLQEIDDANIIAIDFGKRDNVIPSEGYLIFSSSKDINMVKDAIQHVDLELGNDDKNFNYNIEEIDEKKIILESKDISNFLQELKTGLIETFSDGFPLLSANVGKISIENDEVIIKYSIRSSDKAKENDFLNELKDLSNKYGITVCVDSVKPFFSFKEDSMIRRILQDSYKDLYGKETTVKKIHACMEGGILSNNIKDLDICTIAPTIEHCHSVNEDVSISSTERVYEWLKETLQRFNKI